jgi:hypothetical protein
MRKRTSRPARGSAARSGTARARPRLEALLEKRIAPLSKWLAQHAPYCVTEQAHLDDGSRERAYWHYGYAVALADVRDVLRNGRQLPPRIPKK